MSIVTLSYYILGAFCLGLLFWLTVRIWREMRVVGPAASAISLFVGLLCCILAYTAVSYLVIRTTLFDWLASADLETAQILRFYAFTALLYFVAFVLSFPAVDVLKKRFPTKIIPLASMLLMTLSVLATLALDQINNVRAI